MANRGLFLWLLVALAGFVLIVRVDIAQRRSAFQADASAAHRILGQRAAQHDAVLATIALLGGGSGPTGVRARLAAVYPQVLDVAIGDPAPAAQQRSRAQGTAVVDGFDAVSGRYRLVLAAHPASVALLIDARAMMPWNEWPIEPGGPIAVSLVHDGQALLLQTGLAPASMPIGLTEGFVFEHPIASRSQPFELRLQRATGPAKWPWPWLAGWLLASALGAWMHNAWLRNRRERRRAQALVRIARVSNLNAMGELAAGMAHELNQPLAAALANAQAARRLLDDDPASIGDARDAIVQAAMQSRRAAEVVARLRSIVGATGEARSTQCQLRNVIAQALALIEPQCRADGVGVAVQGAAPPVDADPVALEQILQNLLSNALRALVEVPRAERKLRIALSTDASHALLVVHDNGPGLSAEALDHLFEPFYTSCPSGLGLGLSLSRRLAESMGATLDAENAAPRGAAFSLRLRLSSTLPVPSNTS